MEPLILDLQVDNAQAISSINAFFDIYEKGVDGMAQSLGQALGKPVEVGVELKMEGDKIVASGVEKVNKELDKTLTAAKLNNKEFGRTPNEIRKSINVLKAIRDKTEKYKDGTKQVTDAWAMVTKLLKLATAEMDRFNKAAKGGGDNLFNKLVSSQIAADTLMGAFRALTGAVTNFVQTGAEMEVLFLQLKGFTGGVDQAAAAYQRFVEIGQATPFTAKQVATAARTMMGFGIETQTAIAQVEKLAIVASATGGDLGMMGRNLGQIQANQKAYTRDLMQFANQGIPIYQELALVMGTSTQHVRELAEEGKIGFSQVSAALSSMTQEGSAFAQIASEMDRTFSAKAEAMQSAFENFAGQTLTGLNKLDQAMGGPIVGTMEAVIDLLNGLANGAKTLGDNAAIAAPIIFGLAGAIGAVVTLSVLDNISGLIKWYRGLSVATSVLTTVTWLQVKAQAALAVLTGNFVVVGLAAIAAIGVGAYAANQYATAQAELAKKTEELSAASGKQKTDMEELAEMMTLLKGKNKEITQGYVNEIQHLQQLRAAKKTNIEMALAWIKEENDKKKEALKDQQEASDLNFQKEKDNYSAAKDRINDYYDNLIDKEKQAQEAMKERHSRELAMIDAKTPAEKALQALQEKNLIAKQRELRTGSEEWLQIQVRLDGMYRQERRQAAIARQKEESKRQEKQLKELEAKKTLNLEQEEARFKAKERTYKEEKRMIKEQQRQLDAAYKAQEQQINDLFDTKDRRQFNSHQEAMTYIADEKRAWEDLETQIIRTKGKAFSSVAQGLSDQAGGEGKSSGGGAKTGYSPLDAYLNAFFGRASGGPVSSGQTYTVNELGKEAFLSASGRLSMINAPSYGQWKAPTSGTVIPAHLTKELNIPAGGVNLNQPTGMSRRAVAAPMAGGDTFHQNVTVQAANPVQAANSMMVEMTRMRRRRFG